MAAVAQQMNWGCVVTRGAAGPARPYDRRSGSGPVGNCGNHVGQMWARDPPIRVLMCVGFMIFFSFFFLAVEEKLQ